ERRAQYTSRQAPQGSGAAAARWFYRSPPHCRRNCRECPPAYATPQPPAGYWWWPPRAGHRAEDRTTPSWTELTANETRRGAKGCAGSEPPWIAVSVRPLSRRRKHARGWKDRFEIWGRSRAPPCTGCVGC